MNDGQPVYQLDSGGSVVVVSEHGGPAKLYVWFAGGEPSGPARALQLQRSTPVRVTLPQLAAGSKWKVMLQNALVCK
jgi:hypothetical protein